MAKKENPPEALSAIPSIHGEVGRLELPRFYVNHIAAQVSVSDFLFVCGEIIGSSDEGQAEVIPLMSMRMSPQHAKALAKLLGRQIEDYEKQYGPIPFVEQSTKKK